MARKLRLLNGRRFITEICVGEQDDRFVVTINASFRAPHPKPFVPLFAYTSPAGTHASHTSVLPVKTAWSLMMITCPAGTSNPSGVEKKKLLGSFFFLYRKEIEKKSKSCCYVLKEE